LDAPEHTKHLYEMTPAKALHYYSLDLETRDKPFNYIHYLNM